MASSPVPTDTPAKAPPSTIEFEPPLACVRRILKQSLPKSTHVGKDAALAFTRSCGIFVIYLTTCANDIARENKRQTITANDVLAAIKELDFDEFTPELQEFLAAYRDTEKKKKEAKAAKKAAAGEASAKEEAKKADVPSAMSSVAEPETSQAEPETEGDDDDKTLDTAGDDTAGDDDKTQNTAGDDDKSQDTNDDEDSKATGAEKEGTEDDPMEE